MAAMYMAGWTVAALSKGGSILEGEQQGMETRVLVAWAGDEPVVVGVLAC